MNSGATCGERRLRRRDAARAVVADERERRKRFGARRASLQCAHLDLLLGETNLTPVPRSLGERLIKRRQRIMYEAELIRQRYLRFKRNANDALQIELRSVGGCLRLR